MHPGLLKAILSQGGYDPITLAYVNGMTTKPIAAHIRVIDAFVKQTKPILLKGDLCYLGSINDSNDSFRNLCKDAHHGTKQGTGLVWDTYWGYSNPAGTGWVDTNYNPATQGVNYTLNNAGIAIYHSTVPKNLDRFSIYAISNALTKFAGIESGGRYSRMHTSEVIPHDTEPFKIGLQFIRRTASNNSAVINQNIPNVTSSGASAAVPNANFNLFRYTGAASNFYQDGLNFTYIGASLTDSEFATLNDEVNDYLIQCLFLKYGEDNWGVKMAKSYFLTLHNFAKYEAWEVYEFIKRHQSDYTEGIAGNLIPIASSSFETDGTAFWTAAPAGSTKTWNSTDFCIKLSRAVPGQVFIYTTSTSVPGRTYNASFKVRSLTGYVGIIHMYVGNGASTLQSPGVTTQWQTVSGQITNKGTDAYVYLTTGVTFLGDVEFDDITLEEVQSTGYYYNTFGPLGQNKQISDYIMFFKAGGNLATNIWTKTGTVMRWNNDGKIAVSNTLYLSTRGTGLGIVTVTSTDGWGGLTVINNAQTNNSVNSFYGNYPNIGKIKTFGKLLSAHWYNRYKRDFNNDNFKEWCSSMYESALTFPGGQRFNLSNIAGGSFTNLYFSGGTAWAIFAGDVSVITNQVTAQINISGSLVTGHLQNLVIPDTLTQILFSLSSLTKGTSIWNKNVVQLSLLNNKLPTSEVNAQLAVIDNYFVGAVVPIKNLTLNLSGSTMGIPTGGASNVNLLSIIAKHVAAGFTATITVRTV